MELSKFWRRVEFPKIPIKIKNCKTFCETQTARRLKGIVQPPTKPIPNQIKSYYVSGTEIFWRRYTEIYRHLLSKCFENTVLELQEMVQCKCFFSRETETCLLENIKKLPTALVYKQLYLWEAILQGGYSESSFTQSLFSFATALIFSYVQRNRGTYYSNLLYDTRWKLHRIDYLPYSPDRKLCCSPFFSWKLWGFRKKLVQEFVKLWEKKRLLWGIEKNGEIDKSSPSEVFLEKVVLEIWSKFTVEQPSRSVISIKLLWNFIEITLRHGVFM